MTQIRVTVRVLRDVEVDVDVPEGRDSWVCAEEAWRDAIDIPEGYKAYRVGEMRAIRGRLIEGVDWFDLHGRSSIVFARAAIGCALSEKVCDALAERLATLGLEVEDRWNIGTNQVSFRVKGRKGDSNFTPEQRDFLRGPERIEEEAEGDGTG